MNEAIVVAIPVIFRITGDSNRREEFSVQSTRSSKTIFKDAGRH